MAAASTSSASNGSAPEVKIVSEIPGELRHALLSTVKTFYSPEQAIITYYVMINTCISEEKLRSKLCMDQKQLRQLTVHLKQDKLIKERLIQVKSAITNKNQSVIYYFINYKAITNVFKYKIEHMRQRIENRARSVVHVSAYKCSGCGTAYDTIEVDRIMDPRTGELKCWRCASEVVMQDVSSQTNSQGTIAHFNVQLRPLFELLQQLEGVQLAPHLCEPDINKFVELEKDAAAKAAADELVKQQQEKERRPRVELGARAFGADIGVKYRNADTITVDMNAGDTQEATEGKAVPIWLQAHPDDAAATAPIDELDVAAGKADGKSDISSSLALHELAAFENAAAEEPEPKRIRLEEESSLSVPLVEGEGGVGAAAGAAAAAGEDTTMEGDEFDDEDDEDEMVAVQGEMIALSDVTNDMVERMTAEEKAKYVEAVQRHAHDY